MDFKISELFAKLRPFILDLISLAGGGSGPFAPSPHDLSGAHHSGSIADSQATQFLKTDGSRGLTGNLAVTDGITIDGVDLSALASTVSGHTGATAAAGHGSVGAHDHQSAGNGGQLDHGNALTGLGDDDHTQYLNNTRHDTTTRHTLGTVVPHDDHGALSGLGDDDHSQYLLVNGTRDMAGNLTPAATDTYDIGSSVKLWRKGYLSELDALVFAEQTITLVGGWLMICKDQGSLAADINSSTTNVDFGKAMTFGDFVLFRGNGQVEYMKILSPKTGTTYQVTRDLDGSGANDWVKGTPFAVLGCNGTGRIELNAYDTPRMSVIKQGTTYNATTELIRLGDLNGGWGYTSEKYGLAIGQYASNKPNIVIDEDGYMRFRIYSSDVMTFYNGNADITGKLRMPGTDSAIAIGATPPTSASVGTGLWLDRNGFYGLASSVVQVSIDAATGALAAGAGDIKLDVNGLTLKYGLYQKNAITWVNSWTTPIVAGQILVDDTYLYTGLLSLKAGATTASESYQGRIELVAQKNKIEGGTTNYCKLGITPSGVAIDGYGTGVGDLEVESGLIVGSVSGTPDAKVIGLAQQDTDPTNASGYGKVWYGGGKDWLWGKNDAIDTAYPLGVAVLTFGPTDLFLTGAALGSSYDAAFVIYRNAQNDTGRLMFTVPRGWGGRAFKVNVFWAVSTGTGNVRWGLNASKLVVGSSIPTSATVGLATTAAAGTTVRKMTFSFTATTTLVEGAVLALQLYRLGSDALDTATGDAYVFALEASVVD